MLAAMLFTAWDANCLSLHHANIKQIDMKHKEDIMVQLNLMYVPRALLLWAIWLGLAHHFSPWLLP